MIDTGVDFTHLDLQDNEWRNAVEEANGKDDDGNGLVDDLRGWDFVAESADITDAHGHGTSVAGIIAAEGNNGVGITGVMWRAGLMSLRVLDENGSGDVARAVEAIDYAATHGAQVINLSWGTDGESIVLQDALRRAGDRGAIVVCAAGNGGRDTTDAPYYPASFELSNLVSVAASDGADQLAPQSNWSRTRVHIAAPGINILTTKAGGGYHTVGGTSAAAGLVSGVAGLIRTVRPRLRAERAKQALMSGVRRAEGFASSVSTSGIISAPSAMHITASIPTESDQSDASGNAESGGNNGVGGNTGNGSQPPVGGSAASNAARILNVPGLKLPNLNALRQQRSTTPRIPEPVPSKRRFSRSRNPSSVTTQPNRPVTTPGNGNQGGSRRGVTEESGEINTDDLPLPAPRTPLTRFIEAVLPAEKMLDGSSRMLATNDSNAFRQLPPTYAGNDFNMLSDVTSRAWLLPSARSSVLNTKEAYTATSALLMTTDAAAPKASLGGSSSTASAPPQSMRAAEFVAHSVPSVMQAGSGYAVAVRMRNTGTSTWTADTLYRLGSQNPQDNVTWGTHRVLLPGAVAPNEEVTFNFTVTAPTTSGTYAFQWRMVQDGVEWFGAMSANAAVAVTVTAPTMPYTGTPAPLPGTIQAGNYDDGGEGVAYHDVDSGNNCGGYRSPSGVDACDPSVIGWTMPGEWVNYTVDVAATGTYTLEARTATPIDNIRFHVEVDGVDKTGQISVPNTGDWSAIQTTYKTGIRLNAGRRVVRVVFDTGSINFFSFGFTRTYDAVGDFSGSGNPAGTWSYGFRAAGGGDPFTLHNTRNNQFGANIETWTNTGAPFVTANTSGTTRSYSGVTHPTDLLNLHPGAAGERSVLRWTVPQAGTFDIAGRFEGLDTGGTTTDVLITHNGANLFSGHVTGFGTKLPFYLPRTVAAGDIIEFSVGYTGADGVNTYNSDSTGLAAVITRQTASSYPASDIMISEFRLRGAGGAADEFVELFNESDAPVTVGTSDGSSGWTLVSSDGVVRATIPAGTIIPARGYYLITGGGYSLTATGAGGSAESDLSYAGNIPDNTGIALFRTANAANRTLANRLDAASFTTVTDPLFREGTGVTPMGISNGEYSIVRRYASNGRWQDTDTNAANFIFVSTNGGIYGGVQSTLGAPAPQNRFAPRFSLPSNPVDITLLDPTVATNAAPNFVRDTTPNTPNAQTGLNGMAIYRRRLVNNTTAQVMRYRFRVTSLTTLGNTAAPRADGRAVSSDDATVTLADNVTTVPVKGMKVEQPPAQTSGGGMNSSFVVDLGAQGLAPGAYVDVQFAFGVMRGGNMSYQLAGEALATSAPTPAPDPGGDDYSAARLDAANATGGDDLFSGNYHWSLPLVGLPGRAGMDLALGLSYNSLVWTRAGGAIDFDADRGFPAPGFQLGFPVVQQRFFNRQTGRYAYLLLTPSGGRVELRQIAAGSGTYEAADSSYLQLQEQSGGLLVRATDGTQMLMVAINGEYRCIQIKDRNGNYLSAAYDAQGNFTSVTDTLGRTIEFDYDLYQNLIAIRQPGRQMNNQPYRWATFGWRDLTINTDFRDGATPLVLTGVQNGSIIPVIDWVGLPDGSYHKFTYTAWGQVSRITHYAADSVVNGVATDSHPLNYTNYNLPADNSSQSDCPRFTQRTDWAENWNVQPGAPTTATINYGTEGGGTTKTVTLPDGTIQKVMFYTDGWQRGLTSGTETWSGGAKQKWTSATWTQDDPYLAYRLNPRPTDTNVYDAAGNRRRTSVEYTDDKPWRLPRITKEYKADGVTEMRRTETTYNFDANYTDKRLIGLPGVQLLYGRKPDDTGEELLSKVEYLHDQYAQGANFLQRPTDSANAPAPVQVTQHDSTASGGGAFGTGLTYRGNVTNVRRYNVVDNTFIESKVGYLTTGASAFAVNPRGKQSSIEYADKFADGNNARNTFAYPTKAIDPDNFSSTVQYEYLTGATTRTIDPKQTTQANTYGAATYDPVGRLTETATYLNNVKQGYVRYEYPASGTIVHSYTKVDTTLTEAHSWQIFDGAGRGVASASEHLGSTGLFRGQQTIYDVMGRAVKQYAPTEMTDAWVAVGDDGTKGWTWTEQTYDWKGRPRITSNSIDATTKEITYGGCGCAGGEAVTIKDEAGRLQRMYHDALGRVRKTENIYLDYTGAEAIYRTFTNTYNGRDQVVEANGRAGVDGAIQTTTTTYDGHGRPRTMHTPQMQAGTVMTYDYNPDDTLSQTTDARNATATYNYNDRGLTIGITYGGIQTPPVSFGYDEAGNRASMSDGLGSATYTYNTQSQLRSETRNLTGVRSYTLDYDYNLAGQLKSISNPADASTNVGYTYDKTGQLTAVTGNYGGVPDYAHDIEYRAWGATKRLVYGNGLQLDLTYNNKMQTASQKVTDGTTLVMGWEYDYWGDGQIRYSHDLKNDMLDRRYSYDSVGRLSWATSGKTAQGLNVDRNDPYEQGYGYDVFDNLRYRSWRVWRTYNFPGGTTTQPSTDAYNETWENNKNTAWTYDAAGNLKNMGSRQYNYDAAGRMTYVSERGIQQAYDGDDRLTKRTDNGATVYYVRSSALGGMTVAEVNGSGARLRGYVYAGGQLLAKQEGGQVYWDHRDARNTSNQLSNSARTVTSKVEMDPLGVYVPPNPVSGGGANYNYNAIGFYGTPNSQSGGCVMDGVAATCASVMRALQNGAAGQCPNNDCSPRSIRNGNGDPVGWARFDGSGWTPIGSIVGVSDGGMPRPPLMGRGEASPSSAGSVTRRQVTNRINGIGGERQGRGGGFNLFSMVNFFVPPQSSQGEWNYENWDNCTKKYLPEDYPEGKPKPDGLNVGLAWEGGLDDVNDTAMILALWAKESNFNLRPPGDHGPLQLTSWWSNHSNKNNLNLIVPGAYDSFSRPAGSSNRDRTFTGNVRANIMTNGNIIRYSRNTLKQSYAQIGYWYGPGSKESPRDSYGAHAARLQERYAKFLNCLKTGQ